MLPSFLGLFYLPYGQPAYMSLVYYIEPGLHPVTNLSPPRHAMWWERASESIQFSSASSVTLEYPFSLFYSFPSPVATACVLFLPLAFSHISYISCVSPFSFIGPFRAYFISVTFYSLSGANSTPNPNAPWDILKIPFFHLDRYSGSWPIRNLPGLNREVSGPISFRLIHLPSCSGIYHLGLLSWTSPLLVNQFPRKLSHMHPI